MPIYQIAEYRINASALDTVKRAIVEFVEYVRANEPGTRLYQAWQQQADPTRLLHLFIFEDEAAKARHSESAEVRRFDSVCKPELIGGEPVVFTGFNLVATNDPGATRRGQSGVQS